MYVPPGTPLRPPTWTNVDDKYPNWRLWGVFIGESAKELSYKDNFNPENVKNRDFLCIFTCLSEIHRF